MAESTMMNINGYWAIKHSSRSLCFILKNARENIFGINLEIYKRDVCFS